MKYKHIFTLLVLLIIVAPFVVADSPKLETTIIKYEPIPAQPGQHMTAYIQVENTGTQDAPNAALTINDQFPFTVVNQEDKLIEIGVLKSKQSYVYEVELIVDTNAAVGNNNLKISVTPDQGSGLWVEADERISIKPTVASLAITQVKTQPEQITPGEEGTVIISVKNNADILLRNVALQLGMITAEANDIPFIPTSVTQQRVSRINPGEVTDISFSVKAYPSATPGYYKIPLSISFFDDEGTQTQQTDIIGLIIKAKPELKLYLDETTIPGPEQKGEVTLKFVNKGVNDLKFLDINILEDDKYEIHSTTNRYIGDLDSDDYRTESFNIETKQDHVILKVNVSYKDENNNEYEDTLEVYHDYTSSNNENKGVSPATIILIILVVGIIGRYVWKKRKHKKKK